MDHMGYSDLRKTLPLDIQQLIQDAHDQLWWSIPDPWYPKGTLPPISSDKLFNQFSVPNQVYPNLSNYQVAKQCVEKAIEDQHYQEGMDILFSVNRYTRWTDNLEEARQLFDKIQQIVSACPKVAVAPQLILRKFRWLRDRGDYQSADKLVSSVLSQAANCVDQETFKIGTWSFTNLGDFYRAVCAFLYLKGQIQMYLAQPVDAAVYAAASCQLAMATKEFSEGKVTIIPVCLQILTDLVLDMSQSELEQVQNVVMVNNSELSLIEYLSENGGQNLSSLPERKVHALKPLKRRVRMELGKLAESKRLSSTESFHTLLYLLKSSIPENLEWGILQYHEIAHDYATSVFNVHLAFKYFGHMSEDILLLAMRLFVICKGGSTGKDLAYFQREMSKVRVMISNLLGSVETDGAGSLKHGSQYPVLRGSTLIELLRNFKNPDISTEDFKKSPLAMHMDKENEPTTVDPVATTLARNGGLPSNVQKFKPKLFLSKDFRPHAATSTEHSDDLVYQSVLNLPSMVVDGFNAPQQFLSASKKREGTKSRSEGEGISGVNTCVKILQTNLTRDTVYRANVARYHPSEDQWRYQKTLVFIHDELHLTEEKKGQLRDAIKLQYLHQDSREVMYVGKRYRRKTSPKTYHNDVIMHQLSMKCVSRFNKQLQNFPEYANRIRMVPVVYMEILDETDQVIEVLNVEPFVHGNFTKMTNNLDTVNSQIDTQLLLAFSHFTWCDSDGQLMVTDLQGWIPEDPKFAVILTDPAINSQQLSGLGLTNMGNKGFKAFWTKQHPTCNDICGLLNLERDSAYLDLTYR